MLVLFWIIFFAVSYWYKKSRKADPRPFKPAGWLLTNLIWPALPFMIRGAVFGVIAVLIWHFFGPLAAGIFVAVSLAISINKIEPRDEQELDYPRW
jgi:hypothetical protein